MKKKKLDPYAVERYRVVSEFVKIHFKKSILELSVLFVLVFIISGLFQSLFIGSMFELYDIVLQGGDIMQNGEDILRNVLQMFMIILLMAFYFVCLSKVVHRLFDKFRDDYRSIYMSGLTDKKIMWELVYYPIIPIMIGAILGVLVVQSTLETDENVSVFSMVMSVIIVAISFKVIHTKYNKHFYVITGLGNKVYDISRVDGVYRLIQYLSVEENIALVYRMLRGKDAVKSYEEIAYIARDMKMDGLLHVKAQALTPLHKVQVMILRAYCVAGRDLTVDDRLLESLNDSDRQIAQRLIDTMMNPNIARQYTPDNVVTNKNNNQNINCISD